MAVGSITQIEYDIEIQQQKVATEFQFYEGTVSPDQESLEENVATQRIITNQYNYERYLTFMYGRQRALSMQNMSRLDLIQAQLSFDQDKLNAMVDLQNTFKNVEVI